MPKPKDALGLVLRAAQFAAHKHKDQRRKDVKATPYINHPINLAEVLHTDGGVHDPIGIAAALLHDTIEDTGTTYDELRGMFGTHVADVVIEVTEDEANQCDSRSRRRIAIFTDWHERRARAYGDFTRRIAGAELDVRGEWQ